MGGLPAAGGGALFIGQKQAYDQIHQQAQAHLQQLTQHKKDLVEQALNQAIHTLEEAMALQADASARPSQSGDVSKKFEGLLPPGSAVTTLLWIDAQGTVAASNRPSLLGNSFKGSERYKTISGHPSTSQVYLSEPFVTPLGKFTFSLGKMVSGQAGEFNGYVLAIVAPHALLDILQENTAHHDVAVALVHDSGKVILRIPDSDERVANEMRDYPDALFWQFMRSGQDAQLFNARVPNTGKQNIINYQRIQAKNPHLDHSLVIGTGMEHDTLFAPWRIGVFKSLLGWMGLAALGALLVMWKTRSTPSRA